MPRVFSGIQPTGDLHLGNLLGAMTRWTREQHENDAFFCIVDLHALTIPKERGEVGHRTLELARGLMAAGLDPEVCTLFVQSHVHEHAELAWLLQCVTSMGELRRMTQFKDKSEGKDFVSAGLFTYPALQAADILLYDTERVPVGEDQRQHIELTRDVAERFNHHYGRTFVLPTAVLPAAGARVMDLQEPTTKMSKSAGSEAGRVLLADEPATILRKFKRAVTDSGTEVRYDTVAKPGVSNLLSILAAATDRTPEDVATDYSQYGPLKADTGEAVVELLRPIQKRVAELEADPAGTAELLRRGADKARTTAASVLERARTNVGMLPRT